MATPRLGLVVEDKPTELSCTMLWRVVGNVQYKFPSCTCVMEC